MKNLLKKSVLFGMGAISLTREKAEKFVRELEEKGEIKSHETKDFVSELVEKGEQERILFNDAVKRELKTMGLVTKSELAAVEERIKRLEERVGVTPGNGERSSQAAGFPSGE